MLNSGSYRLFHCVIPLDTRPLPRLESNLLPFIKCSVQRGACVTNKRLAIPLRIVFLSMVQAVIFDIDGTIIDSVDFHIHTS
jgi:hypothetical protein